MQELPIELLYHCVEALEDDPAALKSLRLTSKILEQPATEVLFKKAIFNYDEKSATRLRHLVSSRLNTFVRTVILTTSRPDNACAMLDASQVDKSCKPLFKSIIDLQRLGEV